MKLLILQKRAVILGLFFYVLSIAYVFFDPANDIKELNQIIEKFQLPLFGEFNTWIVGLSAILSLGFYFVFYFLAYRNSKKAVPIFIAATFCACIALISDMGPQIDSGVNTIITLLASTIDGIILACLLIDESHKE
jgi:hypothetical protein